MTNNESERLDNALIQQGFSNYEIRIIRVILGGQGNLEQDDILRTSEEGVTYLRKLGWYRRIKQAFKTSKIRLLDENNQIII